MSVYNEIPFSTSLCTCTQCFDNQDRWSLHYRPLVCDVWFSQSTKVAVLIKKATTEIFINTKSNQSSQRMQNLPSSQIPLVCTTYKGSQQALSTMLQFFSFFIYIYIYIHHASILTLSFLIIISGLFLSHVFGISIDNFLSMSWKC